MLIIIIILLQKNLIFPFLKKNNIFDIFFVGFSDLIPVKLKWAFFQWPFNHAGENQGVCRAEQEEERRLTNCLYSFISDFRDKTLSE